MRSLSGGDSGRERNMVCGQRLCTNSTHCAAEGLLPTYDSNCSGVIALTGECVKSSMLRVIMLSALIRFAHCASSASSKSFIGRAKDACI